MLNDPKSTEDLVAKIYASPFVNSLGRVKKRHHTKKFILSKNDRPNYIRTRQFALALLDSLIPAGWSVDQYSRAPYYREGGSQNDQVEKVLMRLIDSPMVIWFGSATV
jgi:hypothetical protein